MIKQEVANDPLIKDVVRNSVELWESTEGSTESSKKVQEDYGKYVYRKIIFIVVCIVLMFVVMGVALTQGEYPIEFWETYQIVWDHLTGNIQSGLKDNIIFVQRLPWILVGLFAGVGLAVSGVVMQSTLMNPLADPYTTGVSSGASFGATLGIVMGFSLFGVDQYGTVINAFVFSLIPMAIIIICSKIKNSSPTTMIMAGIAVMYIFNAFTTVITLWADETKIQQLYRWTVGSLSFAKAEDIPIIAVVVVVLTIVLMLMTNKLNILAAGDESAKSLGVDADKLRRICLIIVALLAATVVSFTGLIGFVGLVAPHIVRTVIGADNRYLLPASAAFGGLLLISANLVGRVVIAPAVLQVGVITSFLGGPLFLWLILRKNSTIWG
ncbi:MAG: iron ABC transporter permease [archaeon]|nr:iron ABC transporter permease [archaeon]